MHDHLFAIEQAAVDGALRVVEPTPAEVVLQAAVLAGAYNDPHNRSMMAHTHDMSEADVIAHYAAMAAEGARAFLLYRGDALAGDADLRRIEHGKAELAILVASRAAQGKGLGTRFALLVQAFAFRTLGLERIYVSILPENTASRRLFEKLGYHVDTSPEARAHADEEQDITMSIGRTEFERAHAAALGAIRIAPRTDAAG
jgi:RimJ/RimL family protein N-acetyltransferase